MDSDSFPLERIVQHTDQYGNIYAALDPEANPDHKKFIEETVNSKGLAYATYTYPYVPLKLVNRLLVPDTTEQLSYDARVTNNFHIMQAKSRDESYGLHLQNIYSLNEEKEPLTVSLSTKSSVINENDGIGITPNDQRSEEPIQITQVKNWHPNRDANGNYMSAQQLNNYANYMSSVVSSPYYGQSYLSNTTQFQYPF